MALPVILTDLATGKAIESFKTSFGRMLGISTYQKERSVWNSVSWVDATTGSVAIASPDGDGSIELCDIFITAEKKQGGTLRLHFDDGTNEKEVVKSEVDDGVINVAVNLDGKVQGWQSAILYYTIVGAYSGSILVTFIKRNKADSISYSDMAKRSGW